MPKSPAALAPKALGHGKRRPWRPQFLLGDTSRKRSAPHDTDRALDRFRRTGHVRQNRMSNCGLSVFGDPHRSRRPFAPTSLRSCCRARALDRSRRVLAVGNTFFPVIAFNAFVETALPISVVPPYFSCCEHQLFVRTCHQAPGSLQTC